MIQPTVLIITHDYPPIRSAGTERILRFAQHLPDFGYRPIVLTTGRYGTLADDVDQGIFRAGDLVHSLFGMLRRGKEEDVPPEQRVWVATVAGGGPLARLRDGLMVPDTKLGWLLPAVQVGRRILAEQRPALIFSSSPPETTHLIAGRLSRAGNLPWVADLRDGWVFEPPNASIRQGPVRGRLEARLEQSMVRQARQVITATDPLAADLARRYPQSAARFATISNGYEESEFAGLARQRRTDGHFLLTYTGSLSASREGTDPAPFFQGLALFRQRHPQSPVRLRVVGNITQAEKALAQRWGVDEWTTFLPPVSRREAHQHQLDADALLLITAPGQRTVASLKLFEYIRAGMPIFALAQDNAAAAIVEQYDLGVTVSPTDAPAIAAALENFLARCARGEGWPGFAAGQPLYSRSQLTGQLAGIFDQILGL